MEIGVWDNTSSEDGKRRVEEMRREEWERWEGREEWEEREGSEMRGKWRRKWDEEKELTHATAVTLNTL